MTTKTKPKAAPDLWVESVKLKDADKKEVISILGCDEQAIEKLEELLQEQHHWLRLMREQPMASHVLAELEELYIATHALEELLIIGQLSAEAKNRISRVYSQHLIPYAYDKFSQLNGEIENLARFTRLAIEVIKIEGEDRKKETGGTAKQRAANYKKDSLDIRFLQFFAENASAENKLKPKCKKGFLKICGKYIAGRQSG